MRSHSCGFSPFVAAAAVALAVAALCPSPARGGVEVYNKDELSLELGLRMQPRMEISGITTGRGWQRDFLIRRARLKANGKVHRAVYMMEWKIDGTDQIGATPSAQIENCYIQYPLGWAMDLRVGLYDQPFSRDRLTSDSKQLAVDRGAVSDVPAGLGLADNAFGLQVQGRAREGHAEYTLGLFDNQKIAGAHQVIPMAVGRLDLNFGSSKDVFRDAHFGDQKWFSIGFDGSYQGGIENAAGAREGSTAAAGVDGMVDVPVGPGRLLARGEFNNIQLKDPAGGNSVDTRMWMAGLGILLFHQRFQPIVRFDQVLLDDVVGGGSRNITYAGANFYQDGHKLKVQADIRFEAGTQYAVDGGRLQAQVDF